MAWFGCVLSTSRAQDANAPPNHELSEELHSLSDSDSDGDEMRTSNRRPDFKEFN